MEEGVQLLIWNLQQKHINKTELNWILMYAHTEVENEREISPVKDLHDEIIVAFCDCPEFRKDASHLVVFCLDFSF